MLGKHMRHLAGYAAAALFGIAASGCNNVLDVPNPQAFGNETLDTPAILKNVTDGAEGLMHLAWDDVIVVSELLSDEMESTSTWIDWEDISEGRVRRDWATNGSFSGPMDAMLRARFASQDAAARVQRVLKDQAANSKLLAQVRVVDAMADLLIGMAYCEGPLVPNAARSPDTDFFKQAITKFNTALSTAQASGDATLTNVARAGRARANLLAGNYDAALADAQAVPANFQYNAIYAEGAGSTQSTTGNQFHQNRNRSGGLRRLYHPRVRSIDSTTTGEAYLRDWFDNTQIDRRMAVTRIAGQLGVNNRIPYYGITKYNNRASAIRMLSSIEMQLIEAEVAMRKNDYATMTAKLNALRGRTGVALPPIPVPTTAADAQRALLNERQAELFIEGHRLQDLARFGITGTVLGPNRAIKLPMSRTEILNNTSMKDGDGKCPNVT